MPAETRAGTLYRDTVPLVRTRADGVILDTIGLFPGKELFIAEEYGLPAVVPPPFRRELAYAAYADRLYVGTGDAYEINALDGDGRLRAVFRRLGVDLSVSDDDLRTYREGQLARYPSASMRERLAGSASALACRATPAAVPIDSLPWHPRCIPPLRAIDTEAGGAGDADAVRVRVRLRRDLSAPDAARG